MEEDYWRSYSIQEGDLLVNRRFKLASPEGVEGVISMVSGRDIIVPTVNNLPSHMLDRSSPTEPISDA